jgi:hypothetical protein
MFQKNRLLVLSISLNLIGSIAYAGCPNVGGYKLSAHNANHTSCTYTSYSSGSMNIQGTKASSSCPRFTITDPGYRQVGSCQAVINRQAVANPQGGGPNMVCSCTAQSVN